MGHSGISLMCTVALCTDLCSDQCATPTLNMVACGHHGYAANYIYIYDTPQGNHLSTLFITSSCVSQRLLLFMYPLRMPADTQCNQMCARPHTAKTLRNARLLFTRDPVAPKTHSELVRFEPHVQNDLQNATMSSCHPIHRA